MSTLGVHVPSPLRSLQGKQDLLQMLIADETTRLMVWLFPLDHSKRHLFHSGSVVRATPDVSDRPMLYCPSQAYNRQALSAVLRVAWEEDPELALNLTPRFKFDRLDDEVRWYILNHPEKAMNNADALQLMFRSTLPNDVSSQLKVSQVSVIRYASADSFSISCIGLRSIRSLLRHSSCQHTATIPASFNTPCGLSRAIPLMSRSFTSLRLSNCSDMMCLDMLQVI